MASGVHKMPSRGKYRPILAAVMSVATVALLAVAFQQNRELADLRSKMKSDLRLRENELHLRDEHLRYVYGFLLKERGGRFRGGPEAYQFEGGFRASAGDGWCVVNANEDFDRQQLYALLEFIAPLVFPRPAYRTHTEDHVEWVKALFENDLEQLKRSSKTSERYFVQRTFSGDVERLGFEQAIVTTVTISASARSPFTVRMELSPEWQQAWGLWLSN
jgi:hypothetical protein